MNATTAQRIAAEFTGSALLLAIVVGSGIMGETLAGGNAAIALLGNAIATGAGLYGLITVPGPISGAHFNPAVSIARSFSNTFAGIQPADVAGFIAAQLIASAAACLWLWLHKRAPRR
jgi:glycerol uptake facilitator-like aquaporin